MALPGVTTNVEIGPVVVGDNLTVKKWRLEEMLGYDKPRTLHQITGLGVGRKFGVHNSNTKNMLRGIYERVLYRVVDNVPVEPPIPHRNVFNTRCSDYRACIASNIRMEPPWTDRQVVEFYFGAKRVIYERARLSLASKPLCRADAYVSTFLKCEKIDFSTKPDPAPRVIQPRSPRYNLCVARYLKPLEKKIFKGIAVAWGGTTIVKGYNAVDSARVIREMWDQYKHPVAIGFDATRFDQHVSLDALKFEHSVYEQCVPERYRPKLARLLEWQCINRGYANTNTAKVMYEVEGKRMSGDINTSLGNCVLMSAMMHSFKQHLGIDFRLANNGDDCVVITEKGNEQRILQEVDAYFKGFGFVMECENPVYRFEKIEFCQTQPVCVDGRWTMCRNPLTCLDKDSCTIINLRSPKLAKSWLAAVGECGLALASGMPMLQEFYEAYRKHGKPGKGIDENNIGYGLYHLSRGMHPQYKPIAASTRISFWRAFNIPPAMQVAWEDLIRSHRIQLTAGLQPSIVTTTYQFFKNEDYHENPIEEREQTQNQSNSSAT